MKYAKIYFILFACVISADDSFESFRQSIQEEYNEYYQKEKKAFESYSETLDGIPNKINPYQDINILPPKPIPVAKVAIPEQIKKTMPSAEPKIVEKAKNTLPEGIPSGSQIKTVKLQEIDIKKLVPPQKVVQAPSVITSQMLQLSFYGALFTIEQNKVDFTKTLDSKGDVSELADQIHRNNAMLIKSLRTISDENHLNDWDRVLLVQALMNTLYRSNENKLKTIHAVDILRGLGYKVLLGEGTNKEFYFLLPAKQQIYAKSYIDRDGQKLYTFAINAHPRADFRTAINFYRSPDDMDGKPVDMVMHQDPKIGMDKKTIALSWDYEKKNYRMSVHVNQNLTALMDMYPQVGADVYMQSVSGMNLIKEIAVNLKRSIDENRMSNDQAVAFVLRFSQQAFTYKTDFDAYGFERPLFVEQTILLPYSDCEDRAILLSHLYRYTLGLESVGLQYPGHISLGVAYNGNGDYYELSGRRFYVTDGTYFYARPGVSQPSFKNTEAKFLRTR